MKNKQNNDQYVEGDSRARFIFFAFLAIWIITGLILKKVSETRLEQIDELARTDPRTALAAGKYLFVQYWILPMSFFFSIHGAYFIWRGTKTVKAGVYPPPGLKVPFRTKVQAGFMANFIAVSFFLIGLCNFIMIILLFKVWHVIGKVI